MDESQEAIDYCLNCTRNPSCCNYCNGMRTKKRRSNALPEEVNERCREMLLEGRSVREIAAELGIGESTVWLRKREMEIKSWEKK